MKNENKKIRVGIDDNEIFLYGDADGLRWLAEKCLLLAEKKRNKHIHVGDYQVLTEDSSDFVLAIFPKGLSSGE